MKTTKKQHLYRDNDLKALLNDTWTLIEQLDAQQLKDLISAIDNVKLVLQYAVSTGMKGMQEKQEGTIRNMGTEKLYLSQQDSTILHFSGKY